MRVHGEDHDGWKDHENDEEDGDHGSQQPAPLSLRSMNSRRTCQIRRCEVPSHALAVVYFILPVAWSSSRLYLFNFHMFKVLQILGRPQQVENNPSGTRLDGVYSL